MASPYAFVTLLTSDSYLPGTLTLAAALRDVHPSPPTPPEVQFQMVCLVTPETVDVSCIKLLRRAYDVVIGVELIEENSARGLQLLGRPDLHSVLTKLHVFRLTQYSKIIFLDADILPTRPLSHLFTLPYEFAAVPDVGWPDIFNSGMMVLSPGDNKFTELTDLSKSKGSWDGGDQGLLNEWRGSDWHRLSFIYNTTPTAAYTYAPAYERFGSRISAIHFIGPNKPWNSIPWRAPGSSAAQQDTSEPLQAYDYSNLVDRWYAVYDKHYRSVSLLPEAEHAPRRYEAVWDSGSNLGVQAKPSSTRATTSMSLEDLRRIAIEGFSGSAAPVFAQTGEGEYVRLPLDGRVDLMRPRPEPESEQAAEAELAAGQVSAAAPGIQHVASRGQDTVGYFGDVGSALSTPTPQKPQLPGEAQPRMYTLPTPGPSELPPTPHRPPLSLPPTPAADASSTAHGAPVPASAWPQDQSRLQAPSIPQGDQGHPPQGTAYGPGQTAAPLPQEFPPQAPQDHGQVTAPAPPSPQEQQRAVHQISPPPLQAPPRPKSPPIMAWNPALEPPPSTVPVSTFPADTYYPNVWDESARDRHLGDITSPPSSVLFSPPPPSQIPQHLLQEGHYTNVLGEKRDTAPKQDRSKVKSIFPWEEQPRHRPGRHFPETDSPPPGLFIKRELVPSSSPSPTPQPAVPSRLAPPPAGMPKTFGFRNAWDSVPSIQTYASRLSRPPQPVVGHAAPFDIAQSRKMESKLFSESYEAGDTSQDGDDEDTEPEENPIEQSRRTRSGSASTTYSALSGKGKKKEYRMVGTQTIPKQTRNQGVQVNLLALPPDSDRAGQGKGGRGPSPRIRHGSTSSLPSGKRERTSALGASSEYTPSHMASSLVGETVKLSPLGSPTGLRSPRAYSPRTSSLNLTGLVQSPPKQPPALRTVTEGVSPMQRTVSVSSDTMSTSPSPSSAGPPPSPSPKTVPAPLPPPVRKAAARVWDPARGVDVFKRGSEEVLARFLRMGSWEEESGTQTQTQSSQRPAV